MSPLGYGLLLSSPFDVCIFCLRCRGNLDLTSITTSKTGCTYGLGHEFPEPVHVPMKTVKKIDKQLCTRCGLHRKNPASARSECEHEYPE